MRRIAVIASVAAVIVAAIWAARWDGSGSAIEAAQQDGVNPAGLAGTSGVSDGQQSQAAASASPASVTQSSTAGRSSAATANPSAATVDPTFIPGATEAAAGRNGSEAPAAIESRLRQALSSGQLGALWDEDVICTDTQCTVRFTNAEATLAGTVAALSFTEFVQSAPIGASGVNFRVFVQTDGSYEHVIEISTSPSDGAPENSRSLGMTQEELDRFTRLVLSPDDYDAPRVVIDQRDGLRLVVENICSIDCPLDLRQVVYWESTEGKSCEEIGGGISETFLARTESGAFVERVLCVAVPID